MVDVNKMDNDNCKLCYPQQDTDEICDNHSCICGDNWRYTALCMSCENHAYCKSCGIDGKSLGRICSDCHTIIYNYKIYGVKEGDVLRQRATVLQ